MDQKLDVYHLFLRNWPHEERAESKGPLWKQTMLVVRKMRLPKGRKTDEDGKSPNSHLGVASYQSVHDGFYHVTHDSACISKQTEGKTNDGIFSFFLFLWRKMLNGRKKGCFLLSLLPRLPNFQKCWILPFQGIQSKEVMPSINFEKK